MWCNLWTSWTSLAKYGRVVEKNIAGIVSQVLILGSIDKEGKVILLHPSQESENGLPVA